MLIQRGKQQIDGIEVSPQNAVPDAPGR